MRPNPPSSWKIASASGQAIPTLCWRRKDSVRPININGCVQAGWVYSQPQDQTVPLYRCYNAQEHSHFASNESDCEKLGDMERLLGYAFRH